MFRKRYLVFILPLLLFYQNCGSGGGFSAPSGTSTQESNAGNPLPPDGTNPVPGPSPSPASSGIPAALVLVSGINLDNINVGSSIGARKFPGFKINGVSGSTDPNVGDHAGMSVQLMGDFNGDKYNDVLIGSEFYSQSSSVISTGAAFVLYGRTDSDLQNQSNGNLGFNLSSINGSNGVKFVGSSTGDRSGNVVAAIGDFTGSGFSSFIFCDQRTDVTQSFNRTQNSYLVLGQSSAKLGAQNGSNGLIVNALDGVNGVTLKGGMTPNQASMTIAGIGDIDGDGLNDLIVSQPELVAGLGALYLVFGTRNGLANLNNFDLTHATPTQGILKLNLPYMTRTYPMSVAGLGDINGDGRPDYAIGVTKPSGDGGKVYVIFGDSRTNMETLFSTVNSSPNGLNTLNGSNGGFILDNSGSLFKNAFGQSISRINDFNGDGLSDFAVSAPVTGKGTVWIIFGKKTGFGNMNMTSDFNTPESIKKNGFRLMISNGAGTPSASNLGQFLSGADLNGDGYADLAITESGTGRVYLLMGQSDILSSATNVFPGLAGDGLAVDIGQNGLQFLPGGKLYGHGIVLSTSVNPYGLSVNLGLDMNGDGVPDMLIGAPYANSGAGQIFTIFGQKFTP